VLDVLMPIPASSLPIARLAIERIVSQASLPLNFVLVVDGGTRADMAPLEAFLHGSDFKWMLLHERQPVYLNKCIQEGLLECKQQLVLFASPAVALDDPEWIPKMMRIFERDPQCGIVDTEPGTKSRTLYPVRRAVPAKPKCLFAMAKRAFISKHVPVGKQDPVEHWSKTALKSGMSSWSAPGVNYATFEHKEHETWREPSVVRPAGKSQSQTTHGSSTQTTTGPAG